MMDQKDTSANDKKQILTAFQQLLSNYQKSVPEISTKREEMQREEEKKIVETASAYTVENIVKGLAELQLDFNNTIDSISQKLLTEVSRREELQKAIQLETKHLQELRDIRIAADALRILNRENQTEIKTFEEEAAQKQHALANEIAGQKRNWHKEQAVFEQAEKERQKLLKREREKSEADYQYALERKQEKEADEYETRKRILERQLAEKGEELEEQFAERERMVAQSQKELDENKSKVESFEKLLVEKSEEAKEKAIEEVLLDAKLKAELYQKDVEANKQAYELKIKSLEDAIEKQARQIEDFSAQLQEALKQAQQLAVKTVESAGKSPKMNVRAK
jgi:hypothetical protein